jgi:hypothetical protein
LNKISGLNNDEEDKNYQEGNIPSISNKDFMNPGL